MDSNFFSKKEMKYIEIGTVLEDFNWKEKGKIFINILLPEVASNTPMRNKVPKNSVSNIKNKKGANGIAAPKISNYVELYIPGWIGSVIKNDKDIIVKGTKVLISFVAGEINKPQIVGVVDLIPTLKEINTGGGSSDCEDKIKELSEKLANDETELDKLSKTVSSNKESANKSFKEIEKEFKVYDEYIKDLTTRVKANEDNIKEIYDFVLKGES